MMRLMLGQYFIAHPYCSRPPHHAPALPRAPLACSLLAIRVSGLIDVELVPPPCVPIDFSLGK